MHQLLPEFWLGKISPNEIAERIKLWENEINYLFQEIWNVWINNN